MSSMLISHVLLTPLSSQGVIALAWPPDVSFSSHLNLYDVSKPFRDPFSLNPSAIQAQRRIRLVISSFSKATFALSWAPESIVVFA